MGTFIFGMVSSLGQIWWHNGAMNRAAGMILSKQSAMRRGPMLTPATLAYLGISFLMLKNVFSSTSPLMSPLSCSLATSWTLTAPPMLCP